MKLLFSSTFSFAPVLNLRTTSIHLVAFQPYRRRNFTHTSILNMADLKAELTAPNGKKITLPTGLFINNEFVKATGGQKITSINPT
jgi:hypothetical protein